jgi:hypothetical protein
MGTLLMQSRRIWTSVFTLTLVLSFGIGLLIYAPTSVLLHITQQYWTGLSARNASGLWWKGEIQTLSWRNQHLKKLHWQLNWPDLLQGNIAIIIKINHQGATVEATLNWPWNKAAIDILDLKATVPIDQLTPQIKPDYPLLPATGIITINLNHGRLPLAQMAWPAHGMTLAHVELMQPATFSSSEINLSPYLSLGRLDGFIIGLPEQSGYQLNLHNNGGNLAFTGQLTLFKGQLNHDYTLTPTVQTPDATRLWLELLRPQHIDGGYRFSGQYNW